MKFWKSYYCRWNPRMRPQDSVHLRHAQLVSLRDQLQAKVESLTRELEGKKAKEAGGVNVTRRAPGIPNSLGARLESINI